MTVISVGVVNKQGRVVLSRQFTDIGRIRIEGLLSAFPRLLEASVNKQVTFIDAGTVRYVYQPLQDLFLVLVTTRKSNIVEDLDTLYLIGRLIPEYLPQGITEEQLEAKTFQIFFALDEVIVCGKRESTTVEQIYTYLKMDSHEEKLALELKKQQMENAKRITVEQAKKLREKRRSGGGFGGGGGGAYGGIGSEDPNYGGFGNASMTDGSGNQPGDNGDIGYDRGVNMAAVAPPSLSSGAPHKASGLRSGMSLGKARKADVTSRVQKEMGVAPSSPPPASSAAAMGSAMMAPAPAGGAMAQEGVHVVVEEKISAVINRDSEHAPVDVKGELSVVVSDPQLDHIKIALAPVSNAFTFRAHTKVNKAIFASDHVLAMVDNKPFPVQQPVTILRWRLNTPGSIESPISFTCWPEAGSITVEYELASPASPPLQQVCVAIPLYGAVPENVAPSNGTVDVNDGFVLWHIPVIDSTQNSSGNIELSLASEGSDPAFFPIEVSFSSNVSVGMVRVNEVVGTENGMPVRFSSQTRLSTEQFMIQ